MKARFGTKLILGCCLMALIATISGCGVYFNTFFNAKQAFSQAEKARERARESGRSGRAAGGGYNRAIEKALKVVEYHPNSKYYDDALYILGASYYHTGQFARAERRFRELLANYEDSKYAREVTVYLAQAKLELGDLDDALLIFETIFEQDFDKTYKAEAAMALGKNRFEAMDYDESLQYFMAVRDSLGDHAQELEAQIYIADGYFDLFKFQDGLGAYLQILGMEPDKLQKYHALYRAALCSYRLQRIEDGFDYIEQLTSDDLYFDSLGTLKVTVAEGYEADGDLIQAEAAYQDVINTVEKKRLTTVAYYRLGLIYQFDYDQLNDAKGYYDRAAEDGGRTEIGRDAIQRSSDIGKRTEFARNPLDSNATVEAIDEAAYTQYLLAELLWLKLDKPDTAILEMTYLVDSFPTSYYAPKGMVALSQMIRDYGEDDRAADSILKKLLVDYPHSDYLPEGLTKLGLRGTAVDTGYAELYIHRAEDYLIEGSNIDSARANYQYVVDNFPDSKYYAHAEFSLIWLRETYNAPGDSSLIFAYQEYADSFPGSRFANEARRRISDSPQTPLTPKQQDQLEETPYDEFDPELAAQAAGTEDTLQLAYLDPRVTLYRRPGSTDTLVDLRLQPIEIIEPFEFPEVAANSDQYDWRLYFQLLIDFSGKVTDYVLKIPSGEEEIDEMAIITVGSMTFDALEVSNRVISAGMAQATDGRGYWFVYEYQVRKPDFMR